MKKIYFKGYYGYKNLGDDIFAVTANWICNSLWKSYKPVFIGKDLPLLPNTAKKIEIKNELLRRIVELLICLFSYRIIYFGGSLFSGGGSSLKDLKFYLRKFKVLSKKTGTIGTSIGPFNNKNNYELTKALLQKLDFISIRDYSSKKILSDMKLNSNTSFCFDNAILINEVFPELKLKTKRPEKIKIAISLCNFEKYQGTNQANEELRQKAIKQLLDDILDNYKVIDEFVFVVFNGNEKIGDLEITQNFNKYFNKKIKTRIIDYSLDTKEMISEINKCDFVIGVRLHSGILAYALEIPFILVEYHPKCTEFLETINHKYRFNLNNSSSNFKNFEVLFKNNAIPGIENPDKFKRIMIEKLKKIQTLL